MKITLILIISLFPLLANSQADSNSLQAPEFYYITEAYLIKNDSIFSLKESFVDNPSGILIMNTGDSSIISIDHGGIEKVEYLGYATEMEDPGDYEFLKGEKKFYNWLYKVHNVKELNEAIVIRESYNEATEEKFKKSFRFHFLFEDKQIMIYCYKVNPSREG